MEVLKRGFACCFERARFIDKASRYFRFETRHVFLIQPFKGLSVTNFMSLRQVTHASSEIYTSRGWIGVDSNDLFMLLSESGLPSSYTNAIYNLDAFTMLAGKFYNVELNVIYGLYSRYGNFFGKNFPGPEYVFKELLWN